MQKRTKIQWLHYFKKNILFEYPKCFSKLKNKKWKQITKNIWKHYQKNSFKYKSPLRIKKRLKKRRQYFNFYLKEKQFFKIYYKVSSEKRFKKILRQSFTKKRARLSFYALLQQRIDHILVRARYAPTLKIARFLIKNHFISINNRIVTKYHHILKKHDILSVDFKIKKYILQNILNHTTKKSVFLRKKKRKKFSSLKKKLKTPKIFEINIQTLNLVFYKNFGIHHFKIANDLSPDMVQRTYRR